MSTLIIITNNREIDHLILCVHGIGQKLGERIEGVNFVHGMFLLEMANETSISFDGR